jgi:methionyl-tRNA formyltransferase
MKIVYFANGERGRVCLQALLASRHHIAGVVAAGGDAELEALCRSHAIPVHVEPHPNTPAFAHQLASLDADVFVCSGYNRILRPLIFTIPPRGTLNLHGGRLPEYRGAAPINWQIINGEAVGGCCILFMDEGIDTGPIARQELYSIGDDDTHQSVLNRTLEIFPRLLLDVLEELDAGRLRPVPQPSGDGTYYSRRFPEDSRIDWSSQSDREVHNLVRGMQGPYPHAFTMREGDKIDIECTSILADAVRGVPGRVALTRGQGVIVICRDRGILVEDIRLHGRSLKPRDVLKPGDRLG